MPNVSELKCTICEVLMTSKEIAERKTICNDCEASLSEANERLEGGNADEEEITPEMQSAIKRFATRNAYMKNYNDRPEVKAKRKQYMKDRAARDRALLKKAKELGITSDGDE